MKQEPPFAATVAERRSQRTYREEPISLWQLGEFLYRVARITAISRAVGPTEGSVIEIARRPYPSGGALYELEVYVAVARCRGVEPGLYFYDAARHGLRQVAPAGPPVQKVMQRAAEAAAMAPELLQTQIVLTSRYERLAWKYGRLSYALTLKHVGVLLESMALTAAAMRLAGCPIGNGMSQDFAEASGVNGMAEVSVGEFLLGY